MVLVKTNLFSLPLVCLSKEYRMLRSANDHHLYKDKPGAYRTFLQGGGGSISSVVVCRNTLLLFKLLALVVILLRSNCSRPGHVMKVFKRYHEIVRGSWFLNFATKRLFESNLSSDLRDNRWPCFCHLNQRRCIGLGSLTCTKHPKEHFETVPKWSQKWPPTDLVTYDKECQPGMHLMHAKTISTYLCHYICLLGSSYKPVS